MSFRGFRVSESLADKELYQRQTEATDQQIDALVYELYGLTEEEIWHSGEAELKEIRRSLGLILPSRHQRMMIRHIMDLSANQRE